MAKQIKFMVSELFSNLGNVLRKCVFCTLSMGPIPTHVAFIMDGNRRYAKKKGLEEGAGHRLGFSALMLMLKNCYELGITYVTIYAFSIDNFKRSPDEVQKLMDLLQEKIDGLLEKESIVEQYGVRVYFIGNLKLLSEPVRLAAEKVEKVSSRNTKFVLLVCLAYTSRDEIVHGIQESCKEKMEKIQTFNSERVCSNEIEEEPEVNGSSQKRACSAKEPCKDKVNETWEVEAGGANVKNDMGLRVVQQSCDGRRSEASSSKAGSSSTNGTIPIGNDKAGGENCRIKLQDIESHMYMAVAPDPDILIRSSGETRLSNFLLWQTSYCPLYSPKALWPDIGLRHLVWAVLNYQHNHSYLEKLKKQL